MASLLDILRAYSAYGYAPMDARYRPPAPSANDYLLPGPNDPQDAPNPNQRIPYSQGEGASPYRMVPGKDNEQNPPTGNGFRPYQWGSDPGDYRMQRRGGGGARRWYSPDNLRDLKRLRQGA